MSEKARELVVALTAACTRFGDIGDSYDRREADRLEAALLTHIDALQARVEELEEVLAAVEEALPEVPRDIHAHGFAEGQWNIVWKIRGRLRAARTTLREGTGE